MAEIVAQGGLTPRVVSSEDLNATVVIGRNEVPPERMVTLRHSKTVELVELSPDTIHALAAGDLAAANEFTPPQLNEHADRLGHAAEVPVECPGNIF